MCKKAHSTGCAFPFNSTRIIYCPKTTLSLLKSLVTANINKNAINNEYKPVVSDTA